jgi:hypothetical protein
VADHFMYQTVSNIASSLEYVTDHTADLPASHLTLRDPETDNTAFFRCHVLTINPTDVNTPANL